MGCHVSINSFPRCGNAFIRKYIQNILGLVTGSDMVLDQVITDLTEFPGEEITDASVWMKKSHEPMNIAGGSIINKTNKMICVVRNPYDAIISMLNLMTRSHSGVINEDMQKDIPAQWQEWVRECTQNFKDWH